MNTTETIVFWCGMAYCVLLLILGCWLALADRKEGR